MNKIIAIAVLLAAQPALAMQNIKLGPVDLNPMVGMKQSYDSNIYLYNGKDAGKNRRGSLINRSMAGVNAGVKFGSRLELKGGYTLEALSYNRQPDINNAVHHLANLALDAKLPRNTTLTFKNDFAQTTDQATSQLIERAKRLQNVAAVTVDSPLRGQFGFGVNVQHTYNNYDSLTYKMLDRQELLSGFNVNYKLQPKTKVFIGYTYGDLRYADSSGKPGDATYNNVDLGVTGTLGPKLVGTVTAGTQMRNYKQAYTVNGVAAADKKTTASYGAQVQWKPLEKTEVVYYGKRGNVESSYSASRYYTSTLNDLSASREVNKFKVGVGTSFETVQYPEDTSATKGKRVDENFNARLTVDYSVQKWLKAGAAYPYKNRASNEKTNNYKDNVIGLELKGMF